jgi:RNA polymerase sigma factor (sigma-70 family)
MKPIRSDLLLIDTFLTGVKADSESAFETLVKRHGPLVLGVCRHVLRQHQDAEDAFQATFLALARKAGTIHNRGNLACWLREVAYRTAIRLRASRARSTPRMGIHEMQESRSGPELAASRNELCSRLRAEVDGLPAKYRLVVTHTYMEGHTSEQVAALLERPVGTIKGQLARARHLLRARMTELGWTQDGSDMDGDDSRRWDASALSRESMASRFF